MRGWHGESQRHSLAARGIRTGVVYIPSKGVEGEPFEWVSSDGFVGAEILVLSRSIDIYHWQSNKGGEGRTKRALQELRDEFPGKKIYVHGIGDTEEDTSWKYWVYMAEKGHVDVLLDDGGGEVYV